MVTGRHTFGNDWVLAIFYEISISIGVEIAVRIRTKIVISAT